VDTHTVYRTAAGSKLNLAQLRASDLHFISRLLGGPWQVQHPSGKRDGHAGGASCSFDPLRNGALSWESSRDEITEVDALALKMQFSEGGHDYNRYVLYACAAAVWAPATLWALMHTPGVADPHHALLVPAALHSDAARYALVAGSVELNPHGSAVKHAHSTVLNASLADWHFAGVVRMQVHRDALLALEDRTLGDPTTDLHLLTACRALMCVVESSDAEAAITANSMLSVLPHSAGLVAFAATLPQLWRDFLTSSLAEMHAEADDVDTAIAARAALETLETLATSDYDSCEANAPARALAALQGS